MLYGDFVELMASDTVRRRYATGETIFREGDAPDGFHLLLSGSVGVSVADKSSATGGRCGTPAQTQLATLRAGDYFGENALLSHSPRNATVTCLEEVEVLRLSREDFEAGFVMTQHAPTTTPTAAGASAAGTSAAGASAAATTAAAARQTLSFMQMVSIMARSQLARGEYAFRAGEAGAQFFIIEGGVLRVEGADGTLLTRLGEGECFGEQALLTGAPRNASVRCESSACRLLAMDVEAFWRIMRRSTALHAELSNLAAARVPEPAAAAASQKEA